MSRGTSRRVQRMLKDGTVTDDELSAAGQEADLLAHPYIGVQHVELARLRLGRNDEQYQRLHRQLQPGVRRRWWRPRGPRSALRKAGLAATEDARRDAERD